ncbi:MAG: Stp1/IreP family PP2C-type Ser/Thr phosphatase [Symbiobacteriaceae bacterium]|nr:Stp1/IreP family PP2C-type Ser/Thr phosphatase [Symbiobacteriaceae bacterium]
MASQLDLVYAEGTDTGLVRSDNQDALFAGTLGLITAAGDPVHLFLVADGMGGYQGGDVAARVAATFFRRALWECHEDWPATDHPQGWGELLRSLVLQTNTKVIEAQATLGLPDMGTTLTAAVECQRIVHVVHVGDSRLYHFDGERLYQVTSDHSLVAELQRQGQITDLEARYHPKRNMITQALGAAWDITVETKSMELAPNSKLLLCSDGLSSMISDEDISAVIQQDGDPYDQVHQLISLANNRGGEDNITVIIVGYRPRREEGSLL